MFGAGVGGIYYSCLFTSAPKQVKKKCITQSRTAFDNCFEFMALFPVLFSLGFFFLRENTLLGLYNESLSFLSLVLSLIQKIFWCLIEQSYIISNADFQKMKDQEPAGCTSHSLQNLPAGMNICIFKKHVSPT